MARLHNCSNAISIAQIQYQLLRFNINCSNSIWNEISIETSPAPSHPSSGRPTEIRNKSESPIRDHSADRDQNPQIDWSQDLEALFFSQIIKTIGFRHNWQQEVREKRYVLNDHSADRDQNPQIDQCQDFNAVFQFINTIKFATIGNRNRDRGYLQIDVLMIIYAHVKSTLHKLGGALRQLFKKISDQCTPCFFCYIKTLVLCWSSLSYWVSYPCILCEHSKGLSNNEEIAFFSAEPMKDLNIPSNSPQWAYTASCTLRRFTALVVNSKLPVGHPLQSMLLSNQRGPHTHF